MLSPRDIDRLKARTRALRQAVALPVIAIDVWYEGEEEPPYVGDNEWQLRIMIERSSELQ